jgi:hypothetical protein
MRTLQGSLFFGGWSRGCLFTLLFHIRLPMFTCSRTSLCSQFQIRWWNPAVTKTAKWNGCISSFFNQQPWQNVSNSHWGRPKVVPMLCFEENVSKLFLFKFLKHLISAKSLQYEDVLNKIPTASIEFEPLLSPYFKYISWIPCSSKRSISF